MSASFCQMASEYAPPASKFEPERDMPDMSSRVVIVTGGNTGIGKETVKALLKKNAKVYMASRSKEKAIKAIEELKEETGKEAIFLELDLANLESVAKAANEFKSKESCLHVLFNSGGVMVPPIEELTANGYDLQFGTNVLGHAHFTLLLIPELAAGARSSTDGKARVVNTSSDGAYYSKGIDFDTLRDGPQRKKKGAIMLYAQSKLGNILFSNELAHRFADQGITSNALNPGHLKTDLQRHVSKFQELLTGWLLFPAPLGALTQLWVGTSPETAEYTGQWFIPWARLGKIETKDDDAKELWSWIEKQRESYL